MYAILLTAFLATSQVSDLNDLNKYFVFQNRIENNQKKTIAKLAKFEIYVTNSRHSSKYDNGRRLRLYSHLGYTLENIPMYHNRFYNECIEIFLEIEEKIPKCYDCLRANGQQAREISGLRFSFPNNPEINKKTDITFFMADNAFTCTQDGQFKTGPMKLAGLYEANEGVMYVTLSTNHYHWISAHEYIHASGYAHSCDKDLGLERRTFKCAMKPQVAKLKK